MRLTALILALCTTAALQADILYLRDGSRHYGAVVSEDKTGVTFRVVLPGGTSSLVRIFAASEVQRVERTGREDAPPASGAVAPTSQAAPDYEQMLREGFELLDDGDWPAALKALQAAVDSSAAVCQRLDDQCRAARGVPLDELLATLRVYLAGQVGRGRGFKLESATDYERAALVRVLDRQLEALLTRVHDERTIADWVAAKREYSEVKPDARAMVMDLSRAAALMTAKARFDTSLRQNRGERLRLSRLHEASADLAGRIRSLPGYNDLDPDDRWVDPTELPPGCHPLEKRKESP